MSAHEHPGVPEPDQPSAPDHQAEMEEIERLKAELGDRVGMLRDRRPAGRIGGVLQTVRGNPAALAAAAAGLAAAVLARVARR